MEQKRESIFRATIRNFFGGFALIFGIFSAFIVMILIIAGLEQTEETYTADLKKTVLPDAQGKITELSSSTPIILQIDIKGVVGLDKLTSDHVRRQLIESRYGDLKGNVKAILLSIESPGGTVMDADAIYLDLLHYKETYQVPIYAHVDGMCASGAYYIAMVADKIFATDVSLIGSVGVLMPTFINVSKLLTQYNVETLSLTAGKGKDELNPLRPWAPDESKSYQHIIDFYYQDFVNLVSAHRPLLEKEKLIEVYGAHVFPAKESEGYGYIDASGKSRSDTLMALTHDVGLGDKAYQVVRLDTSNWFNEAFRSQNLKLLRGNVEHHLVVPGALDARLEGKLLYLHHPSL